jgi:hypothetical protein
VDTLTARLEGLSTLSTAISWMRTGEHRRTDSRLSFG